MFFIFSIHMLCNQILFTIQSINLFFMNNFRQQKFEI